MDRALRYLLTILLAPTAAGMWPAAPAALVAGLLDRYLEVAGAADSRA